METKKIFGLLFVVCLLQIVGCSTNKNFIKIYCEKGDPSSIRLIPKDDPFKPICDSISFLNKLTIGTLDSIGVNISSDYNKTYREKVQELSNKTYFDLDYLRRCYQLYISRPCDDNAYNDYIQNLTEMRKALFRIENLNADIEKITKGGSIIGNSETGLIDRISLFLNEK